MPETMYPPVFWVMTWLVPTRSAMHWASYAAAIGKQGGPLMAWPILASGAVLGMAVFYTSSAAHSSAVEGLRLHTRYYHFMFPRLLIIAVARTGGDRVRLAVAAFRIFPNHERWPGTPGAGPEPALRLCDNGAGAPVCGTGPVGMQPPTGRLCFPVRLHAVVRLQLAPGTRAPCDLGACSLRIRPRGLVRARRHFRTPSAIR